MHTLWEKLLTDVETACDETKTINRKEVLETTDRLYDMIRSDEDLPENLERRLFHILAKFFEKFGNHWIIISTTSFVLTHMYGVYPIGYFAEYHIISGLLSYVSNPKREIRDAVAQSLGAFAKAYDKDIFNVPSIINFIKSEKKTVEEVEGFMVALGYIGSNMDHVESITEDVLPILIENTLSTKFDTYSAYVRAQALRGLARIMKKKPPLSKDTLAVIEERAFLKLGDDNINVRKEAAKLSILLGFSAESLIQRMKFTLETAKSWEIRHGVCFAFHCLVSNSNLISELSQDSVTTLFEILKVQVELVDKNINAYNANSVAGQAIAQLFVTIHGDIEMALKMLKLENSFYDNSYDKYVHPTLIFMFKSPIAQLLDGAVTSFYNLLTKCPTVVKEKEVLMVLLFKNRFHASGPIQISSRVVWQYGKSDLTELTPALIAYLKEESLVGNFEIKESVFKAIDDVLCNSKSDKISVDDIFTCLVKGANDSGPNSDVPRSAALNAIGSLISYSFRVKYDFSAHLKDVIEFSTKFLTEQEESVVYATLNMLRSLAEVHSSVIVESESIGACLLCLSKDDALDNDNIKYLSIALLSCLKYTNPFHFLTSVSSPWSLSDENEVEKKEACARVYREVSSTVSGQTQFSPDLIKRIIKDITNGLFEEKESTVIQSNLIVSLRNFFQSNYFMQGFVSLGGKFSCQMLNYITHVFANKLSDFEVDTNETPKIKTPHAFNYYNLGLLKYLIEIVTKIRHFVAPDVLSKFLDNLSQLLFQQDAKFKPYVALLLVTLITEKVTSNGIIGLAKGYVTEFEVKGTISTSQQVVDQCIGLLKSPTFAQVPFDKKVVLLNHLISGVKTNVANVEGCLDVLIEVGKSETDPIIKARIIQLLQLTAFDDQFLNVMTSFFFEKVVVASDDEKFYFFEEAVFADKAVSEFSPFYINNLIADTLKSWWNQTRIENVNLTDEKHQQLIFASYVNTSINKFSTELLPRVHLNENADQLWKWRIATFVKENSGLELVGSWKDLALSVIKEKRRVVSSKTYVAAFVVVGECCKHLKKLDVEFLQLLSEAFIDEELEEERYYLIFALNALQALSTSPVVPPKPRLLQKVDFNSTFSKSQ